MDPLSVAVIGSGFGGIGMAVRLKQAGVHDFAVLEKDHEVGGTWRDNTYPGAACDVPSHLYSYSFEPKKDWSRRFPPQAEILGYLRHCVRKYGVGPHLRFGCEVTGARFDQDAALWRITTTTGEMTAKVLISACGQLNRPAYPPIEGRRSFRGAAFHSARWDHCIDLTGRRVAVIGTGASARSSGRSTSRCRTASTTPSGRPDAPTGIRPTAERSSTTGPARPSATAR